MNIDKWLAPISEDSPCGENIEYDLAFIDLTQALEGKPEQQYGDTVIPREDPDWKLIISTAESLLEKSKDLRVISALTQAWTATKGVVGLADGCRLMLGNLNQYWEDIYPPLYDDGELDPFFRINALGAITSVEGIIRLVRASKFISSPLNGASLTFKDVESLLDGSAKDEDIYPGGKDRLIVDLKVAHDIGQENMSSLQSVIESLEQIEQIFITKLGEADKVDFDVILKPFRHVYSLASVQGGMADADSEDTGDVHSDGEPSLSKDISATSEVNNNGSWRKLNLKNRDDVTLVMEKICVYFETYEPSHPAPLFIRRIQRLMNLNFYDIIKDISPDSLSQVELLIGQKSADDTEQTENY